MRTLVIDTATQACSVALFEGADLLAGSWHLLHRGHAERLLPMIADLPGKGRADRIAVCGGPGSFTGLRVGAAAARALALPWDAEVMGYSTMHLVAAMARAEGAAATLAVAMTGGHGEWFVETVTALSPEQDCHRGAAQSITPVMASATVSADCIAGSQAEALVAMRGWGKAWPLWPDARCFNLLHGSELYPFTGLTYGRQPDAKVSAANSQ